jgi:hypothetical protein
MEKQIQLQHPAGRKAVTIDREKYELLRKAMINHLLMNGESTHTEILRAVKEDFQRNQVEFEGSVEWYLEWVKLDLEAKKEIRRNKDTSSIKFCIF